MTSKRSSPNEERPAGAAERRNDLRFRVDYVSGRYRGAAALQSSKDPPSAAEARLHEGGADECRDRQELPGADLSRSSEHPAPPIALLPRLPAALPSWEWLPRPPPPRPPPGASPRSSLPLPPLPLPTKPKRRRRPRRPRCATAPVPPRHALADPARDEAEPSADQTHEEEGHNVPLRSSGGSGEAVRRGGCAMPCPPKAPERSARQGAAGRAHVRLRRASC